MKRRTYISSVIGTGMISAMSGCLSGTDVEVIEDMERLSIGEGDIRVRYFEDLMCPACASYKQSTHNTIVEDYVNEELITFEVYDLAQLSRDSEMAAMGARAVQELGNNELALQARDDILDQHSTFSRNVLSDILGQYPIDSEQALEWVDGGRYENVIQQDIDFATDNQVRGTPSFLVSMVGDEENAILTGTENLISTIDRFI